MSVKARDSSFGALETVDQCTASADPRSGIPFGCGEIDSPDLLERVG